MAGNVSDKGCKWIGPEQDSYMRLITFCDKQCVPYRSYCSEHVFRVYQEGTAQNRKRATFNQAHLEFWEDLFESAAAEIESEGLEM